MTTALAGPRLHTDGIRIHDLFQRPLAAWGRAVGRPAIAASHQRLFDTWLNGTRLTGRIESVRFLGPDVALVHATGGTIFPGEQAPRPSRDSIQTLVAVRQDVEWHFTAFHNGRVLRRTKLQWMPFGIADKLFRR